jgi:DDE superfamily endonuclease
MCCSHGFSRRTPCFTKTPAQNLEQIKNTFAIDFWRDHSEYSLSEIINADETAVYFDTPPHRIWAVKGKSAKVKQSQKHSDRLTAMLTVRADGKKLPIFFIVKGQPAGIIESQELPTYPPDHFYAVQENAWMDARTWEIYVKTVLRYNIDGPSVLLLDNFDAHVSEAGVGFVAEEANSIVCPLPPNATSMCQPLDVGVMGPFKSRLRSRWLRERARSNLTAAEKRMVMIRRSIAAWEDMSESVVAKSFEKAVPKTAVV